MGGVGFPSKGVLVNVRSKHNTIPFKRTTIAVFTAAALGAGALAYHQQGLQAAGAGQSSFEAGDIIMQVNGKRIENAATLKAEVAGSPRDKPVALVVKRGDGTLFIAAAPESKRAG